VTKKFDEEKYECLKLEVHNVREVEEKGERASYYRCQYEELPSPDMVSEFVRELGFDTFEITHVTEKVMRYSVD